jgi:hypothetical protein
MAALVALREAHMGIEPHYNLRNHFFDAQSQRGSGTEEVA